MTFQTFGFLNLYKKNFVFNRSIVIKKNLIISIKKDINAQKQIFMIRFKLTKKRICFYVYNSLC